MPYVDCCDVVKVISTLYYIRGKSLFLPFYDIISRENKYYSLFAHKLMSDGWMNNKPAKFQPISTFLTMCTTRYLYINFRIPRISCENNCVDLAVSFCVLFSFQQKSSFYIFVIYKVWQTNFI